MALKWRYREHRDGETAQFKVCGLDVYVQDCDGDFSQWDVRIGRTTLADGVEHYAKGEAYHFDAALEKAEAALRSIIANRLAELRAARSAA